MEALEHLLIVLAGVFIINAALSAVLWARNRTPLHRALFGVWAIGIVSMLVQGMVQSDRGMPFAFGIMNFAMNLMLTDLVGRALGLRRHWTTYGIAFVVGLAGSILATAMGAPFWVRALPITIGSTAPLFDLVVQFVRLPRRGASTTGWAAIVGTGIYTIHLLDYPFLRDDPRFATLGFVFAILGVFAISISGPAIILEHTSTEITRLNGELEQRVAEALTAVKARDEFLTIAAHEIRGPLNALHLAVQTLRDGKAPADAHDRLYEIVERSDRRLAQFVDQLLDLGRMSSGILELEIEQVDMAEVIHEVGAQLEPELRRSGSTLAIKTGVGAVGAWDRFRLGQVVSNLLSNAIKFGLGRPIEIATSMVEGDARLVVTDHGAGMSNALKERVFDPFERGVSVLHHGGLGLGLHIVREIVTALGGTVTVESTPNAGTSFEVRLPLGGPS